MCARFALTQAPVELEELFGALDVEPFPPRYNIAPTQPVLALLAGHRGPAGSNSPARRALLVRWGLIPAWTKDVRRMARMFNARAETAAEKASFRAAMRHRRALVPASGFYEWRAGTDPAQAYWIRPRHGGIVAFAALVETYAEPGGSEIDTGAVLTTSANADVAPVHDRMPVVIQPSDFDRWLDCVGNEPRHVADLMRPAPANYFEAVPVSTKVNNVANSGPDLHEPHFPEPVAAGETAGKRAPPSDPAQLVLF